MNYRQKIIEVLTDSKTWSQLKSKLEVFNTSKTAYTVKDTEAGKLFEYFAKAYFKIEPEHAQLYKNVWLYDEVPLKIKEQLSFPLKDFGIDLLLEDYQNRYYAVQCKFKNDEQSVLQWTKDKLGNAFGLAEKCDFVIIFTNASNIHTVAKEREKLKFIGLSDLLEVKSEVLENLRCYFETQHLSPLPKHNPLPHQLLAISQTINHFNGNDRGQLILPCGAGKTLAALWIKEELNPQNTLVLFPSLALLRQFKNEWSWHRNTDFEYICICSEKDIDKNTSDTTITHTYEISGEVTTQPSRIKDFLENPTQKIVFSTYQSIEAIEEALKLTPLFSFDLIICDEAHRTAGSKDKNQFTIVHDDNRIRAHKRLYMTATPKVVSNSLKSRLGDDYELLCDMSNPDIFGNEAYRMSFGEAIQKEILVDYKIIGIGVTHKQVKEFIDQRKYVNSKYSIDEIAHNYALDNVMNKYNASHSISFHSKVQFAREFSERHISFFTDQVYSQYVEGNQPTSYRISVLNQFKNSEKGVVSNARCLTEGVDVPTIDLIYFCDPKTSKIDIVQASGRALRKDRHGKKTEGYIVVPIFHYKDDDIEKEIEKKPFFLNLVSVIRSLCDQDERLQAEIDNVAFNKSDKKSKHIQITYDDNEIDKIIRLEGLEAKVREYLFDQIIEKTRDYWELMFKQLVDFKAKYGHTNVLHSQKGMIQLSNWITEQRSQYYSGRIRPDRMKKLEEIGFDWKGEKRRQGISLDELWKESYNKLVEYFNENGNSDVPARYTDKTLGTWCVTQRVKRNDGKLEDWQIELLDKIVFTWKPKNTLDDFMYQIRKFKEDNGHTRVIQSEKKYGLLPIWVNRFRIAFNNGKKDNDGNIKYRNSSLPAKYIQQLNDLGFLWSTNLDWDGRFNELSEYLKTNGHSNVSQKDNSSLYQWCYAQYKAKNVLDPEKIEKLNSVGFDYNFKRVKGRKNLVWKKKLEELKEFYRENGHYNIPKDSVKHKKLVNWLRAQRNYQLSGKLTKEEERLLMEINFSLKDYFYRGYNSSWDEFLKQLKKHHEVTGRFHIPSYVDETRELLSWIRYQKNLYKQGRLEKEKEIKLREIGYSFDIIYRVKLGVIDNYEPDEAWYLKFDELKNYISLNGTSNILIQNKAKRTLNSWALHQQSLNRYNKLGVKKYNLLKEINFPFDENDEPM